MHASVLNHVDCFIQFEVVMLEIVKNCCQPGDLGLSGGSLAFFTHAT